MLLLATSATMATDAVLVRAPPQHPRLMAGSNLKRYLPMNGASNIGIDVATTPQTKSLMPVALTPADEGRSGGDADDRDKDVEADGVHEPESTGRETAEGGVHRPQPTQYQAADQYAARDRQRHRDAADLHRKGADKACEENEKTDPHHVRGIRRAIRVTDGLFDLRDVGFRSTDLEDIAPVNGRLSQDRYIHARGAAGDLLQVDAASEVIF